LPAANHALGGLQTVFSVFRSMCRSGHPMPSYDEAVMNTEL